MKPVIHKHREDTFILPSQELADFFVSRGGTPECSLVDWAAENFANPNKLFIDVGAHVGTWSIPLSKKFAHVFAFEAQKQTFQMLVGGIALSQAQNVYPHHNAVTDCLGSQSLRIISEDGGGSSLQLLSTNKEVIAKERVNTIFLDGFFPRYNAIGLIKIDVEGGELAVLKGSSELLEKADWPPILFECWADERGQKRDKIFQLLEKTYGYKTWPLNHYPEMFLASRS